MKQKKMKTNLKIRISLLIVIIVVSTVYSNQVLGQCNATSLSPSTINAPGSGGQYSVYVNTGGCTTYTVSNYCFVSYTKNGLTVTVTVPANSGSSRSGAMMIGNKPLTVNQACGNPSAPTSATSDRNNICPNAGGNISLSASGGSGETLNWHAGSCGGSVIGSGNPLSISAPTTTTTYYANWQNSCGSSGCASVTVTVKAMPTAPTSGVSNHDNFCPGTYSTITLTAYGGSGTTLKWSLNACSPAYCATGTTATVPAPYSTSTYYAYWENDCGTSGCFPVTVTVTPGGLEPSSVTSNHNNFCPGAYSTIILSASGGSGTTLRWFSGSCGGTDLGTGNNKEITAPSSTTTYFARWENSCGNSICTSVTVNVLPLPVAPSSASSNNNNYCTGTVGNITLTASGGSGTTVRWLSGSCTGSSVGTGNPLTITAPTTTTTYYARWENSCGNSAGCASVTVTVKALPTVPTMLTSNHGGNPDDAFCPGTYQTITLTAYGGTGTTLKWSLNACNTAYCATGTTATVPAPSVTSIYYAHWENDCGSSVCLPITVYVVPYPNQPSSVTSDRYKICSPGGNISLTANGGSGTTLHWFTDPNGSPIATNTNPLVIAAPTTTTTYYARWETSCGNSGFANATITVGAYPVPVISPSTSVCANSSGNIYTTEAGMTDYYWSITGGIINTGGGLTNNTATVTWGSGTGHIRVSYTNSAGCTALTPTDLPVTLNVLPSPTITGLTASCLNGTRTYITESSKSNYLWTITGGSFVSGLTTNTVSVIWNQVGTGHIKVNYSNSFGCTAQLPYDYPVTVNPLPNPTINGPTGVCLNQESTYTTQVGASNYSWSITGGDILSADDYTVTVKWTAAGTGHIKVNYTDINGCSASAPYDYPVTVNDLPSPVISGLTSVCSESQNLYSTSTEMNNYSWTVTGGDIISGGGSNEITVLWGISGTGHVKVNYHNVAGCTALAQTDLPVAINKTPLPQIEGPTAAPLNSTGNVYSSQEGMSSYDWDITGGSITSGGLSTNNTATVTWTGPCSGDIKVNYISAEGCPGVTQTVFPVSIIRTGSSDQNYINTRIAREAFQNLLPDDSDPTHTSSEYTYFDGLGRPIQTVQVKGSPLMNDVVTHIEYDQFGRQKFNYLPYSKSDDPCNSGAFVNDAATDQLAFYSTNLSDSYPFSEKVFEDSPINRVMELGAPGSQWQVSHDGNGNSTRTGNTVRYEYGGNATGNVYLWSCDETNKIPRTVVNNTYYGENTLSRTKIYDENGSITGNTNWTEEFKDKEGKIVLKRAFDGTNQINTYYVYDDFGILRYVIPPATSITTDGTTSIVSQGELAKYCYIYKYDSKKRMVVKKLPGADSVLMVYDLRNRLVATQDGVQRDKSNQSDREWSFIKYDELNRPISTGIIQSPNTRVQMQAAVDDYTPDNLYEDRSTSSTNYYFTDKSFPNNTYSKTYLTLNYYDNYDCNNNGTADYSYTTDSEFPDNYSISDLLNKPTVTKVRQLDPASSSEVWITTVNFYDKYYRIIQTQSSGIQGGSELTTNEISFAGQLIKSKQTQTVVQGTTNLSDIVRTRSDYDHMGRLLKNYHKINNDPEVTLTSMYYNELSQLATKKLHVTNDVGLQTTDYAYNIRGWLKKINEPDLSGSDNDFFGMELIYDAGLSALDGNPQYNGNISGMKWKSGSAASMQKAYGFSYDQLNRLLNARYAEGTAYDQNVDRYTEASTYDKNGNIQSISRKGQISTGVFGDLDVLSYDYTGMGNQVRAIGDAVADVAGRGDFYDFTDGNTNREYYYDNNGNMWLDRNKHFKIDYNQLNLPAQITDTLNTTLKTQYVYTAAGQKIKQRLSTGGTSLLYNGNIVYSLDGSANGIVVQYIITPEGRVTNASGTYTYEYNLKDHLGNTRVAFNVPSGSAVIVQQDDYYPFGMLQKPQSPNNDNKYLYNGKELQQDMNLNWYDYGARYYDPQIGRFTTQDAFAEKYNSLTPYQYAANNPALFIDVNGDSINFSGVLRDGGIKALVNILSDLSEQTGLSSIGINKNGNLTYGTDDKGNAAVMTDDEGNQMGSGTARNFLVGAASDTKNLINVSLRDGAGSATQDNNIGLDPSQIQSFIDGTSGNLNSKTLGFGMTFLHELHHTDFAGSLADPDPDVEGTRGPVVDRMNKIRGELDANPINKYLGNGTIYGIRSQYYGIPNGTVKGNPGYEHVYIPFNGRGNQINYQGKIKTK